ncbi:MAG: hypothetical protein ACRDGM_06740 [bacterium]
MARRKVHLSLSRNPVMTLGRSALGSERLVYILATNKALKYPRGKSRIVYIGTTKRGVRRVASSVAGRAEEALERRGMTTVNAHLLTYTRRTGKHNLWLKLERAVLFMFQYEYGTIPILNKTGTHFWPGKEFDYFSRRTLLKRLREFS